MIPTLLAAFLALSARTADAQEALAAEAFTAVQAAMVLKVQRPDEVADLLVAEARTEGGYFAARSSQQLRLKVPTAEAQAFLALIGEQGQVVQRTYSSEGLTAQVAEVRSRLKAREDVLARYFAVLSSADAKSVVTVEREIVRLVEEIEGLKGRLRALEHRADFADITIDFQFRDRAAPSRDGSSSFRWLNTVNLADLVEDFRYSRAPRGTRRHKGTIQPSGFAPYQKKMRREERAVSPDDVLVRVRAEKHKPQADLDFWEEALTERMTAAGYKLIGEAQRITVGGQPGALLEMNAPFGADDYTYLVVIVPSGNRLLIAEAAGEISRFAARRQAILDAIQAISP